MRWRKKPKPVDLSSLDPQQFGISPIKLDGMSEGGPARPVLLPAAAAPPVSRDEMWRRLGPRVWEVLKTHRLDQFFPDPAFNAFVGYLKLAAQWPAGREHEVFVGLFRRSNADATSLPCEPLFVPRSVFKAHSYILGGSGSGKSSHALAQLLLQLAQPYAWVENAPPAAPPILIIDLKPHGDPFLRAYAQQIAAATHRPFRFFSNNPNYVSLHFDPFHDLRWITYPLARAETLLKALSLIYPEGYGADFFTNEQRVELTELLYRENPRTFAQLVRLVRAATRGTSGNRDARGLYGAMLPTSLAYRVHTDDPPLPVDKLVDFQRFHDQREILYVHLHSRGNYLLSRDIGKLMLFSLMAAAEHRRKSGIEEQAFVFIDEFHRLAARNVVEMMQDARSLGFGFILAHQDSDSLRTKDGDLYGTLFQNCHFKQFLTLEDRRVTELLELISGRKVERRLGGAMTKGTSEETSGTRSSTHSRTHSSGETSGPYGTSSTVSSSDQWGSQDSYSESRGRNQSETTSWQEEMVPGLTPEMIVEVNNQNLMSLVHVKGTGNNCVTPTGGIPVVVQGLYPVSRGEYTSLSHEPWPQQTVHPDRFFEKARVVLSDAAITAALAAPTTLRPAPKTPGRTRDKALAERLQEQLRPLAQRLAAEMLGEFVHVEAFARQWQIEVTRALELAAAAGATISGRDTRIPPWIVSDMENLLRAAGGIGPTP